MKLDAVSQRLGQFREVSLGEQMNGIFDAFCIEDGSNLRQCPRHAGEGSNIVDVVVEPVEPAKVHADGESLVRTR